MSEPQPTGEDMERGERFVHQRVGATYPDPLLVGTKEARRLAVEFARVRVDAYAAGVKDERAACIRDMHDEAKSWNEGSGVMNHMEFAERRIAKRGAS